MSDKIKLSDPAKSRMLAWVNALRSDEYTQCQHMLEFREFENSPADNCCLGVLCRVAMADGLKLDTQQVPGSNVNISGYATRFDENTSSAPIAVLGWLLDHEQPTNYGLLLDQNALIKMNDMEGKDFHEIADYLCEIYDLDG